MQKGYLNILFIPRIAAVPLAEEGVGFRGGVSTVLPQNVPKREGNILQPPPPRLYGQPIDDRPIMEGR